MGILEGILYMLWRGIAIGVIISAPMGPVGILCVQRTLAKGRKVGFHTGVGAAVSDLFYCLLTGFGLSFIEDFLERNQNVIQIIGSVVLIGFAYYLFRSNPSRSIKKPDEITSSPKRDIINGFLFTVSNPLIIFLIIGLFARFNFLLPEIKLGHYIIGFCGIIAGALGWWWMVTFFIDKVRSHFNLRSMWLINKIIGSIIAIFGVVGIITAVSGLVSAQSRQPVYLNSLRGFGPWDNNSGNRLFINGNDSLNSRDLELATPDFDMSFRARNLNNLSGSRYAAGDGSKIMNPGWRIMVSAPDDTVTFHIRTIDDYRDPLGPTALGVTVTRGDSVLLTNGLRDKLNWGTGWNSFRISHSGNRLRLLGGDRSLVTVADLSIGNLIPSSVSIAADPAALVEVDWIELVQPDNQTATMGYVADPDVMNTYLNHSEDAMEGVWEVYERSLDDSRIDLGGNYRLLLANDDNGYELIYLGGAKKNPGFWKPGMLKARMVPTDFKNIFNVFWVDATGRFVDTEIEAQYLEPSTISLQFPYQNSSLSLRRVIVNYEQPDARR